MAHLADLWQHAKSLPRGWLVSAALAVYIAVDKAHLVGEFLNSPTTVVDSALPLDAHKYVAPTRWLSSTHNDDSDALLFLIVAIFCGTAVTHLTMFPIFHSLQQSVVLFVVGILYALCHEGMKKYFNAEYQHNLMLRSYEMWMDIDPHLILFTMLPALLTGDAMTLDTSVARRVAKQCIYLASVGVLFCTAATALFCWVYLPYNWSFLLCTTAGAILCATDPVAVVALLKELGASPTLTVQIQGESLLNDGTAIVLYTVARSMILGKKYDLLGVMTYLVQKVMGALGLGIAIGYFFLFCIRKASSNSRHSQTAMIQTSLTICCAYWSFIFAEGVLHINGVLATVSSALVLAHMMWPAVVNKEAMHTVWHVLEYLGNSIIFFLAGALTGKAAGNVQLKDYFHLCVIYCVLILIRFSMLYMSRPILQLLSEDKQPVTAAEVIVMTWGGLRGAVGLALAIQLSIDRAEGKISEVDAQRVLFYVGGVATLTLLINATTCPFIVKRLGITRLEDSKRKMLLLLHRRLVELSTEEEHPEAVKRAIRGMLDNTLSAIQMHRDSKIEGTIVLMRRGSRVMKNADADVDAMMATPESSVPKASMSRTSDLGFSSEPLAVVLESYGEFEPSGDRIESSRPGSSSGSNQQHHDQDAGAGHCLMASDGIDDEDIIEVSSPCCSPPPEPPEPKPLFDLATGPDAAAGPPGPDAAAGPAIVGTAKADYSADDHGRQEPDDDPTAVLPAKVNSIAGFAVENGTGTRSSPDATRSDPLPPTPPPDIISAVDRDEESSSCWAKLEAFFKRLKVQEPEQQPTAHLMDELAEVKERFKQIPVEQLELLGHLPEMPCAKQSSDMVDLIVGRRLDEGLMRTVNESFLALVRCHYLSLINLGVIATGSTEADVLMGSVMMALGTSYKDLFDFQFLEPFIRRKYVVLEASTSMRTSVRQFRPHWTVKDKQLIGVRPPSLWKVYLHRIVESVYFSVFMVAAISVNAVCMFLEERYRNADNDDDVRWLLTDIVFASIFTVEAALKLADMHLKYFLDPWNFFDFCLVISGIVGLMFELLALGVSDYSSEGRLVRIARVFRVMRLIRLFRLWRLVRGVAAVIFQYEETLECQEHVQKISVLLHFARAHINAQHQLIDYFGTCGRVDRPEVARTILQSQVSTYKAVSMAVVEEHMAGEEVLRDVNGIRDSQGILEELEAFVMEAQKGGVLSNCEVKSILKPVRHHVKAHIRTIRSSMFSGSRGSHSMISTADSGVELPSNMSRASSTGWTASHSNLSVSATECPSSGSSAPPPLTGRSGTLMVPHAVHS